MFSIPSNALCASIKLQESDEWNKLTRQYADSGTHEVTVVWTPPKSGTYQVYVTCDPKGPGYGWGATSSSSKVISLTVIE